MLRRSFLGSLAAAGLPTAAVVKTKRKSGTYVVRDRGTIVYVEAPADWQPRNWRDVPPSGRKCMLGQTLSLGVARHRAKAFNRKPAAERAALWAVVVVTDGRLARLAKGGAS